LLKPAVFADGVTVITLPPPLVEASACPPTMFSGLDSSALTAFWTLSFLASALSAAAIGTLAEIAFSFWAPTESS
jgi:hypothetical protein